MTEKLEKTYREMLKESNVGELDENKQSNSGKPHTDDDPKVEVEDQGKQKKGVEPEKPKDVANRPADDSKKGLKEGKKAKKKNETDDMDADDEDDLEESDETASDRVKRGVPAKKAPLEEGQTKAAGANRLADKTDNLAEGDNPFDKKDKKDDKEDEKDIDEAEDEEDEDEKSEKKMDEALAGSSSEAMDDMGDLLEGQESLQEEHKEQVKTLFAAALTDKTKIIRENLQEQYDRKLDEAISESEDALVESLNTYLSKVVKEWLSENSIALEQNIRTEITESFLGAMCNVFEDHYVVVPDEKLDLVENILDENEEMEAKLNEESEARLIAEDKLSEYKKADVISELSEGMTLTEKERLTELTEDIDFDEDTFEKKAKTIKEGFIKNVPTSVDEEILNEDAHAEEDASPIAKRYGAALSHMSKDQFSMKNNSQDK